jgi:hypothetical protein
VEQVCTTIGRYFAPHRHSALLAAIIAAFAVRPLIGNTGAGSAVFDNALAVLLLVALCNINVDELSVIKAACLRKAGGGGWWVGRSPPQPHWNG